MAKRKKNKLLSTPRKLQPSSNTLDENFRKEMSFAQNTPSLAVGKIAISSQILKLHPQK